MIYARACVERAQWLDCVCARVCLAGGSCHIRRQRQNAPQTERNLSLNLSLGENYDIMPEWWRATGECRARKQRKIHSEWYGTNNIFAPSTGAADLSARFRRRFWFITQAAIHFWCCTRAPTNLLICAGPVFVCARAHFCWFGVAQIISANGMSIKNSENCFQIVSKICITRMNHSNSSSLLMALLSHEIWPDKSQTIRCIIDKPTITRRSVWARCDNGAVIGTNVSRHAGIFANEFRDRRIG